ncbi:MAG: hypothetical protein PF489_14425 [Salinivirgaceae bacterium]|jgi:hypothetical protein|nr:hypothetical protein [Salinivirgaceae bacterium]
MKHISLLIISLLRINKNDIFIGAGNGLLLSKDGASTWEVDYVEPYYHVSSCYLGCINNKYFADAQGYFYQKTGIEGEWHLRSSTLWKIYSMFLMNDRLSSKDIGIDKTTARTLPGPHANRQPCAGLLGKVKTLN